MKDLQDYLLRVYNLSALKGLCRTKKEFAALVGVTDKTLSAAMNGNPRNLTSSLIGKVEAWAKLNSLEDAEPRQNASAPAPAPAPAPASGDYMSIIESQQRTIEKLTATVERQSYLLEDKIMSLYTGHAVVPSRDGQKKSRPDQEGK